MTAANAKTTRITIPVTVEDIEKNRASRLNQGQRCMLAEAFKRRLDLRPGEDMVSIGYEGWNIYSRDKNGQATHINGRFNPATSKKIRDWDDGADITPFEVNVTFPADWRQKLNGK